MAPLLGNLGTLLGAVQSTARSRPGAPEGSPGALARGEPGEGGRLTEAERPLCSGDHLTCLALWEGPLGG